MKHPLILEKELKKKIFETLEGKFFEILRLNEEEVIFYKNLKITRKKCSKDMEIFHIKDTSCQGYSEIGNIHLLDLIVKDLAKNGN